MGKVRLAGVRIENLQKSKREAERYKKQLINFLQRKKDDWLNKELSYSDYVEIADEKKNGRNIKEWIELYENHIEYCDKEISKQNNSLKIRSLSMLAIILISVFAIILAAPNLNKAITGFAANINSQTLVKEIGKTFVNSENFEFTPEIEGQLLSLKITGSFSGNGNAKVYLDDIPIFLSSNLKINGEGKASPLTGFAISESSDELANESNAEENNTQESLPEQTEPNPSGQAGSLNENLSGNLDAEQTLEKPAEQEITKQHFEFSAVCEKTCDLKELNLISEVYEIKLDISDAELTINEIEYEIAPKTITANETSAEIIIFQETAEVGMPVKWKGAIDSKTSGKKEIEIPDSSSNIIISRLDDGKIINTELKEIRNKTAILEITAVEKENYEIEYETPAPSVQEINYSENRKEIKISSPEGLHYTDIISHASLPKNVNVDDAGKIELYWIINKTRQAHPFEIADINNDAIIDYIKWITPSLSEQTFEIILITNAEHLDENKNFISDIFEQVKLLDGIWSEEIPENDYIRVIFEKKLTSKNDITIYPRITSGNPRIEVYEIDGGEKIAEFYDLVDNEHNKIYLNNLTNLQDTFDLKIVGGSVEIEHIIDPTEEWFEECDTIDVEWTVSGWAAGVRTCTATNGASETMTRTTDLTGRTNAYLNFTWDINKIDAGEFFTVYAGTSVATLVQIFQVQGNGGALSGAQLFDITAYISSTTSIRAECNSGGGESCSWDNINLSTITPPDDEFPIFKLFKFNPANDTVYSLGQVYLFNVTINNTNSTAGIEIDGKNYTAWNITSSYKNVFNSSILSLSAGEHSYYWWAYGNGTQNNYNTTLDSGLNYYKVENATGNVQVYLNGLAANTTVELGSTVTINTSSIAGEGRFTLFRDGIRIANSSAGISNTTSANSTAGINITAILEQTQNYTYNSTQRFIDVIDTVAPVLKIVYPSNDSSHSGAVITVNYTVSDLDLQACWYTNSSGIFNYTITCGANLTTLEWAEGNNIVRIYANDSSGNRNMSVANFTVSLNSAPQIYAVYNNSGENAPVTLSAGPASTNITINFSVIDTNGVSDILNNTARVNLTRSGEQLRYNESCSIYQSSGSQANFTCKVMLWWFDSDGLWNISINISDSAGALAYNTTTRLILNTLTGFNIGPGNLSFGALSPGSTNNTDNVNGILLNNTGNTPVPAGGISINATSLIGETLSTKGIYSGNFSVSNTTGANAECNIGGVGGSSPISYNMNDTSGRYSNVTSAFLEDGNYTQNNGTAQENLYICILEVGGELTSQSYSTNSLGSWTIRILLVALAIKNTKKKKKTRLIRAIGLITAEIRENSSENKKETLKLIMQEIQENYPESREDVNQLLLSSEKIPITIFTKKLGCLEALCKYLKENKSLSYHEIAKITARDDRTIWSSYNKAISKQKEPLEIKEANEFIPLSIFNNRKFTILESLILYLRGRGLKYSAISELLERDQRNIWTINSRISKKQAG